MTAAELGLIGRDQPHSASHLARIQVGLHLTSYSRVSLLLYRSEVLGTWRCNATEHCDPLEGQTFYSCSPCPQCVCLRSLTYQTCICTSFKPNFLLFESSMSRRTEKSKDWVLRSTKFLSRVYSLILTYKWFICVLLGSRSFLFSVKRFEDGFSSSLVRDIES